MKNELLSVYASANPAPPEARQFWSFENSVNGDSEVNSDEATVYIYGDIVTYDLENYNWPDDVIPNKFKDELKALGDIKTINVRINSGGGSAYAAFAIMNLLKTHNAKIVVHIDGICASAATFIAMAGDRIITALGSAWMVHLPALTLWGRYDKNDFNKMNEMLVSLEKSMIDIYQAKTGIDRAELERMVNEETWLTGREAFDKGFADEITETVIEASVSADNKTAVFNGVSVDISNVRNKEQLLSVINSTPPPTAEIPGSQPERTAAKPAKAYPSAQPMPAAQVAQTENITEKGQEESIMNLEELKAKYPDIYKAAFNEGVAQGVKDERARIKAIDDMALPGTEAITNKAKYETGITAAEYAVEFITAQKKQGLKFQNDAQDDAAPLNDVPANPAPPSGKEADNEEERALLAKTGERAKNIRR